MSALRTSDSSSSAKPYVIRALLEVDHNQSEISSDSLRNLATVANCTYSGILLVVRYFSVG